VTSPGASWVLRPIQVEDASACARFSCRGYREPWSVAVEEVIREHLVDLVLANYNEALGLWSGSRLAGVVSWTVHHGDPIVFEIGVLATNDGFRRRGVATTLKRAVLDRARQAGAALVLSEVHIDNEGMQVVNEKLGGVGRIDRRDHTYLIYSFRLR
jgi:ribosomal protein S18 acetylase RimI-like enzyme